MANKNNIKNRDVLANKNNIKNRNALANKNNIKNKQIVESGEFQVIFGGNLINNPPVGIELFSKSLNSVKLLLKEGIKFACTISGNDVKYIDNSLILEIKTVKKINSGISANLIAHMKISTPTTNKGLGFRNVFMAVADWLKMKKHLEGARKKNVYDCGNNISEVENTLREKERFPTNIVNYFVDNPKVDKAIVTLFSKNNRKHMTFKLDESSVKIPDVAFKKMAVDIFGMFNRQEIDAVLRIIKPNFKGMSNWIFEDEDGKTINAKIDDDDFMHAVLTGREFYKGLNISCQMIKEEKVTKKGNISHKYTIQPGIGEPYP